MSKRLIKGLFFLPAMVFIIFYCWISIWAGAGSIDWGQAIPITIPFVVAGLLLNKNITWGGLVGILPAIYFISISKNTHTGIELPIGVMLFVYFTVCSYMVFKNKFASK